jgi:hypothetical protein
MVVNMGQPPFVTLPLEIRLEIYSHLFIRPILNIYQKPSSLGLCATDTRENFAGAQKAVIYGAAMYTALSLACKQLQAEVSSFLYSHNTFRFRHPKVLSAFLVQIGQNNVRYIRTLHIVIPWNQEGWIFWPSELLCKLSSDAGNLRNIEITFETIPRSGLHTYFFGSYDNISSLVIGRRQSLEFNLQLAFRRLPALETIVIWGDCSEGWLECLEKCTGCKARLNKTVGILDRMFQPDNK